MLNTRELALVIWIAVAIIFVLAHRKTRPAVFAVIRAFLNWKIIAAVSAAALYAAGCVWLLACVDVWTAANIKSTIIWGLTFAFVAVMDVRGHEKGLKTLGKLAKAAFSASAIVVFIAGFQTLPLWGELLLLPALAIVAGMLAVAQRNPQYASVQKLLNSSQVLVGAGILGFGLYGILTNLSDFATLQTAREFFVPILLSLMFLPFLYLISLIVAYEDAALRLNYAVENAALRRYAFWKGLWAFGARPDTVRRYVGNLQEASTTDRAGVRRVIADLRRTLRR